MSDIKKFDLKYVDYTTLILGPDSPEKTKLIINIIKHIDVSNGYIVTNDAKKYEKCNYTILDSRNRYIAKTLNQIIEKQTCIPIFILIDDCDFGRQRCSKELDILNYLCKNSSLLWIYFLYTECTHNYSDFGIVFIHRETDSKEREKIYKELFVDKTCNMNKFDYTVINNYCPYEIEDTIFYY